MPVHSSFGDNPRSVEITSALSFWKTGNIVSFVSVYSSFGDDPRSVEITSALKKNHLYPIACGQAHLCELGKNCFGCGAAIQGGKMQTRTQLPLIYSSKGIWKGNLKCAQALGEEGGKVASRCALFFLPSLDTPRTH